MKSASLNVYGFCAVVHCLRKRVNELYFSLRGEKSGMTILKTKNYEMRRKVKVKKLSK